MDLATYLSSQKITQAAFAVSLGVSQGLIYQWLTGRRPIAPDKCVAIERLTRGQVGRRDLRPNDWHLIWPELVSDTSRHRSSADAARDSEGAILECVGGGADGDGDGK
ncbi:transcriptional regulator [Pandoraea sputorum]|uniref:transcriptional regulator n=1 Tax=Pandoraea sputorum TaxID=93222 RepID=UPI002B307BBC|nr:hypothetical protein THI4931_04510 [Pandoraea sputorum]